MLSAVLLYTRPFISFLHPFRSFAHSAKNLPLHFWTIPDLQLNWRFCSTMIPPARCTSTVTACTSIGSNWPSNTDKRRSERNNFQILNSGIKNRISGILDKHVCITYLSLIPCYFILLGWLLKSASFLVRVTLEKKIWRAGLHVFGYLLYFVSAKTILVLRLLVFHGRSHLANLLIWRPNAQQHVNGNEKKPFIAQGLLPMSPNCLEQAKRVPYFFALF